MQTAVAASSALRERVTRCRCRRCSAFPIHCRLAAVAGPSCAARISVEGQSTVQRAAGLHDGGDDGRERTCHCSHVSCGVGDAEAASGALQPRADRKFVTGVRH